MVEYAALLPPYKKLDIKQILQNIIIRKILFLILNLMAVTQSVVTRKALLLSLNLIAVRRCMQRHYEKISVQYHLFK